MINWRTSLPRLGVFAFALASTWALVNVFNGRAAHPSLLYWLPAAAIEIVTAWLLTNAVGMARELTRSKISKQDRRFYTIMLLICVSLAAPTVAVSIFANTAELGGDWWLGLLFPSACIGCAVGAEIPAVVARFQSGDQSEHAQRVAKLRGELREARGTIADLQRSREFTEATREAFFELCAGLNGNCADMSGRDAARLMIGAGMYPPADNTAKAWLETARERGIIGTESGEEKNGATTGVSGRSY